LRGTGPEGKPDGGSIRADWKQRGLLTGVAAEFHATMDEEEDDQVFWILKAGTPALLFKSCHRVSEQVDRVGLDANLQNQSALRCLTADLCLRETG
jgi:hypothetical protein